MSNCKHCMCSILHMIPSAAKSTLARNLLIFTQFSAKIDKLIGVTGIGANSLLWDRGFHAGFYFGLFICK